MFEKAQILYLYTETPLHAGSGSSTSWVDLPIQREKHTGLPMIQASGLKGAARHRAERGTASVRAGAADPRVLEAFGPETSGADQHGGALGFTDARLLLFPVRSFSGVFAWATSPLVLHRLARDLRLAGAAAAVPPIGPIPPGECLVAEGSALQPDGGPVLLEDLAFQPRPSPAVPALAELLKAALPEDDFLQGRLAKHLVVLSDDDLRAFAEVATEVVSRIRIDETGTVADGALWSEELLPSDTLLYTVALATPPKKQPSRLQGAEGVLDFLREEVLRPGVMQLGGDETVGRGLLWVRQG
jgi:CRISPR-associated protein Cmr4